ncbi:hypothetical protein LC653_16830 [Nostoc sp. CHAB 5784]|uniref:hypothetical protein n=1 Tax=Nostoc mirabile TaxID=2907820 RepID=UPI001E479C3C|nr:hypothetical protein [Nostoc mirabile]MCC5665539.1 hypothetical protein [Nostoc mirabile CHAB5784]
MLLEGIDNQITGDLSKGAIIEYKAMDVGFPYVNPIYDFAIVGKSELFQKLNIRMHILSLYHRQTDIAFIPS